MAEDAPPEVPQAEWEALQRKVCGKEGGGGEITKINEKKMMR